MTDTPTISGFEIGSRVSPRGAALQGEILEFNADATGALIRWDTGDEVWKALRNLELVQPPPPSSGCAWKP